MGNIPTTNNAAGAYLVGTIGTGSSAPARLMDLYTLLSGEHSPTLGLNRDKYLSGFPRVTAKVRSNLTVRVVVIGDSISQNRQTLALRDQMIQAYGDAGSLMDKDAASFTSTTLQMDMLETEPAVEMYDIAKFHGWFWSIPDGGVVWSTNHGNIGTPTRSGAVHWIAHPNGGPMLIEISTNGGTWGAWKTVDGYAASSVARSTNFTANNEPLQIRCSTSTANVSNFLTGFELSSGKGIIYANLGFGGVEISQFIIRPDVNALTLSNLNPDLVVLTWIDDGWGILTNGPNIFSQLNQYAPQADVLWMSPNLVTGQVFYAGQRREEETMRVTCISNRANFWSPMDTLCYGSPDYVRTNNLTSDGTHPTSDFAYTIGATAWQDCLADAFFLPYPATTTNTVTRMADEIKEYNTTALTFTNPPLEVVPHIFTFGSVIMPGIRIPTNTTTRFLTTTFRPEDRKGRNVAMTQYYLTTNATTLRAYAAMHLREPSTNAPVNLLNYQRWWTYSQNVTTPAGTNIVAVTFTDSNVRSSLSNCFMNFVGGRDNADPSTNEYWLIGMELKSW
jgi:hypothetical protein